MKNMEDIIQNAAVEYDKYMSCCRGKIEHIAHELRKAGYKHESEFEKLDEQKVFSLIEENLFLDSNRFGKSVICGKFDLTRAICAKFSKSEIKYPEKKT